MRVLCVVTNFSANRLFKAGFEYDWPDDLGDLPVGQRGQVKHVGGKLVYEKSPLPYFEQVGAREPPGVHGNPPVQGPPREDVAPNAPPPVVEEERPKRARLVDEMKKHDDRI